jgi:DNA-binding transcriptional LysR family regulator
MLADVDLRQLRALIAVADSGTFGRAAERLGFTQSAVSQQIASLERAVGERLFDRPGGPRPVTLTPAGAVVMVRARAMVDELRMLDDELAALRAGDVGRLVVGTFQSISVSVLPEVIGRLRQERPGLVVRCIEGDDNAEMAERLLADEIDLAFFVGPIEHPDIAEVEVLVDPFVLLSSVGAASPGVGAVDVRDLHGAPMICEQPCACQRRIESALNSMGVEPDYVFRSSDNSAIQAMVRHDMGRAIMPFLAVDLHDPDVVVQPLHPPIAPRAVMIGRRRTRTLIPAAERFIEVATSVCASLPRFEELANAE